MIVLILDKLDLRTRNTASVKRYCIVKKVNATRRHTILNVYSPNNRASKHLKHKVTELKGNTGKPTIILDVTLLSQ